MILKCYGGLGDGVCVSRQGRILTEDEWQNPEKVPDKEFCIHRGGTDCNFNKKGR
jgi:hypothetical protein